MGSNTSLAREHTPNRSHRARLLEKNERLCSVATVEWIKIGNLSAPHGSQVLDIGGKLDEVLLRYQREKVAALPASMFRKLPVDLLERSEAKKYTPSAMSSG